MHSVFQCRCKPVDMVTSTSTQLKNETSTHYTVADQCIFFLGSLLYKAVQIPQYEHFLNDAVAEVKGPSSNAERSVPGTGRPAQYCWTKQQAPDICRAKSS